MTDAVVLGRARWQIELLFKLWKSHGQIDLVRPLQRWRMVCEFYGRLLSQIVQHWLVVVGCWDNVDRSMTQAAQTIRTHWRCLATAMHAHAPLTAAIATLARCLQAGCRIDPRKQRPNTYQRLRQCGTDPDP